MKHTTSSQSKFSVFILLCFVSSVHAFTFTDLGSGGSGPGPSISGNNVSYSNGSAVSTLTVGVSGRATIADTTTPVPGQSGNFSSFDNYYEIPVSSNSVAFRGFYGSNNSKIGIYTGTVGAAGASRVADFTTPVPGQSGTFTSLGNCAISGDTVAFTGFFGTNNSGGGIYTGTAGVTGASRVADTTTPIPGQTGNFTAFNAGSISGTTVAFYGFGANSVAGIYTGTVGTTGAGRIADVTTSVPGQAGTFTSFGGGLPYAPATSGSNVVFFASYSGGGNGIYLGTAGVTGATRIADQTTTAPGHGTFTHLGPTFSSSGSNVAFIGSYSGGSGLFVSSGGTIFDVLDTGGTLFGGTVASLNLGRFGFDGSEIVFNYSLTNGTAGIAEVTVDDLLGGGGGGTGVPEPSTWAGGALLVGAAGWTLRRRLRRA